MSFDQALPVVLRAEGGYVNDPDDPGGATNHGITQRVYDEWRQGQGWIPQPVKEIGDEEVSAIYRARYWNRGRCADLPWPIALVHFDGCVNLGVEQATKLLQRALGVNDDGKFGPVTYSAVQRGIEAGGTFDLAHDLLWKRLAFYRLLVRKQPVMLKFLPQWVARVTELREQVKP